MSSPRSARLLAATITASGFTPGFRCPTGMTVIIKGFSSQNGSASAGIASVVAQTAAGNVTCTLFEATLQPGAGVYQEIWQVLAAGDVVYCWGGQGQFSFWLSGSVMNGAQTVTPAELSHPLELADEAQMLPWTPPR